MKRKLSFIAVFLLCFYASSVFAQDNPDLPVNPKYDYKQDKNKDDKKKNGDHQKKPIKGDLPLPPSPEEPTAVPLDGGLLALLASAGVALYVSRKKKK